MKILRLPQLLKAIGVCLFVTIMLHIYLVTQPSTENVTNNTPLHVQEHVLISTEFINQKPCSIINNSTTAFVVGMSHEILRRRAISSVREVYYSSSSQLLSLESELLQAANTKDFTKLPNLLHMIRQLRSQLEAISRVAEVDLEGLGRVDGAEAWRRDNLRRLGESVQAQILKLQHPVSCDDAKVLVVDVNKACGFGCQIHHLIHCFRLAYGSDRTLVLSSRGWTYTRRGFNYVFEDLSTCVAPVKSPMSWYEHGAGDEKVVSCPIVENLSTVPKYANPAVPADIANELYQLHGAPHVWFNGQLAFYLLRISNTKLKSDIETLLTSLKNTERSDNPSPILGIHVRRTDKINTEASFHNLSEYMNYANWFFEKIEEERILAARKEEWRNDAKMDRASNGPIIRRVFLATDEPSLLEEAKKNYPMYTFIGSQTRAQSAALVSRYSDASLLSVVMDVYGLANTDAIICTFSSQICRLAYELMQTRWEVGDCSRNVQSLDDVYYFGGQQAWPAEAILSDVDGNINSGDKVNYLGNHWDGLAKVSKIGVRPVLAPAFKFQSKLLVVPFGKET